MIDGQTLALDLQVMLRMQAIGRPRNQAIPFVRMRANMVKETALVGGRQMVGDVRDLSVAGRPARHFIPSAPVTPAPGPLLVYLHGGGFIEGDLNTHDAACRVLAERSGVPVVALTYRRGPEDPFPAAHDDADEGYRWVVDHAAEFGADPARIAVGGDSAGGNLAASVALAAADDDVPLAWQLLIYPVTRVGIVTPSSGEFQRGLPTSRRSTSIAPTRRTSRVVRTATTHASPSSRPRSPATWRRRTSSRPASTRSATRARPMPASSATRVRRSSCCAAPTRSTASSTSWASGAPRGMPSTASRSSCAPR